MIAEAYGTFVLTFVGSTAITVFTNYNNLFPIGAGLGLGFIGLAHGVALMIGIATVAQISGAHFNPAVTIGLAAAGKFPKNRIGHYVSAQLVGAVIAAIVELGVVGFGAAKASNLGTPLPNMSLPFPLFENYLAEIVGTTILVMTVLGSPTPPRSSLGFVHDRPLPHSGDLVAGGCLGGFPQPRPEFRPRVRLAHLQHYAAVVVLALRGRADPGGPPGRNTIQGDVPERRDEMNAGARIDREKAKELLAEVDRLSASEKSQDVRQAVARLLNQVPTYNWIGIYLLKGDECA